MRWKRSDASRVGRVSDPLAEVQADDGFRAGQRPALLIVADSRATTAPETQTKPVMALERLWRVVMLDDPVNLQGYVVLVLRRIFGFDETRARKHMSEAHQTGRSVLWLGAREQAEAYVYSLQEWHISAVLEKDEAH